MPDSVASYVSRAMPLTYEAFLPFGEVIEHRGDERRHALEMNVASTRRGMRHAIWVSKLEHRCVLPTTVSRLERHPNSDQAFIPLRGQPFLVVVCPNGLGEAPDMARVRAFVGKPSQGVIYRRNVWHAGLTILEAPAEFVVVMALADDAENDVFVDLPEPLEIASMRS